MQGHLALKQQDELVSEAVRSAVPVQLGGSRGLNFRWGRCLGVRADGALSQIRSTLGNELAQASAKQGLRPIGVVAYIEVHSTCLFAGPDIMLLVYRMPS